MGYTFADDQTVTIGCSELEATFSPGSGMVGVSLRHRGAELLVLPEGLAGYRAGRQGELPLLAPWANRLGGRRYQAGDVVVDLDGLPLPTDDSGLPIHGTLTAAPGWRVTAVSDDRIRAEFDYDTPELLAAFPFPHRLELDATVAGSSLTIGTTLQPTGDRPVPVSFGWHPYLCLPGSPRATWKLHLPACERVELDDRGLPTGGRQPLAEQDDPIGERTFDDLFALGGERVLAISNSTRRLRLTFDDRYAFAQLYAPPDTDFVCVEPMTAPTNALLAGTCPTIEAGQSFTARFSIAVYDEPV